MRINPLDIFLLHTNILGIIQPEEARLAKDTEAQVKFTLFL